MEAFGGVVYREERPQPRTQYNNYYEEEGCYLQKTNYQLSRYDPGLAYQRVPSRKWSWDDFETSGDKAGKYTNGKFIKHIAGNDDAIVRALEDGPVVIGFCWTDRRQFERFAVYTGSTIPLDFQCTTGSQSAGCHTVVIVGYSADYWLVRNSWGEDFGEQGYYKHARKGGCNSSNFFDIVQVKMDGAQDGGIGMMRGW